MPNLAPWPRRTAKSIATSFIRRMVTTMELRTLNDWVVIPRLIRTKGVAEVINFGGRTKQFTVTLLPAQLERFGLTLDDIVSNTQSNNANAGGSVPETREYVVRNPRAGLVPAN